MYKTNRITRKARITALTAIALFMIAFSSSASAIEYRTDQPMIITYQNDYGNWYGCGPVQCTASSWDSQEEAVDRITQERHGQFSHLGSVGRCNVYQSSGELRSYDTQPDEIAGLTQDKC